MTKEALQRLQIHLDAGLDMDALDAAIQAAQASGADVHQLLRDRAVLLKKYAAGDLANGRALGRMLALQLANAKSHKTMRAQRGRRRGKPGTGDAIDKHGVGRNDDIKRRHAALIAADSPNPTSTVAAEFDLSTRRVRQILAT